jgi:hypothetical protein
MEKQGGTMTLPYELFHFVNFDFVVERDERGYYCLNWREYQESFMASSEEDLPAVPEKPAVGRSFDERPIHVSVAKYLQPHRNDAEFATLLKHQEYLRRVLDQVARGEELSETTLLTVFEHAPRMHNAVTKQADRFVEILVAEDYYDIPYWEFQRLYFRGELERVRRCLHCSKFFFDETEEKTAHFCSSECQAQGVAVPETLPEKARAEMREKLEKVARGETVEEEVAKEES